MDKREIRKMKRILAIGGAVIKTAKPELKMMIYQGKVEILIHNGGSLFHDFQQVIDPDLKDHSYPIDGLVKDQQCNKLTATEVWKWIYGHTKAPMKSVTRICEDMKIPVLMFTAPGCDFWHMFDKSSWGLLGEQQADDFIELVKRFKRDHFHYVCMGSAVIHPEIFIKAVAEAHPKDFTADVVDFRDMYRPRTRVAIYGTYHEMSHQEYFQHFFRKE